LTCSGEESPPDRPGLNEACQTVERKVYKDIRELVTIDRDTASVTDVRVLASRILAAATAKLVDHFAWRIQERLNGTADDLRAFLKSNMQTVWSTDLRVAANQTMTAAGANVQGGRAKGARLRDHRCFSGLPEQASHTCECWVEPGREEGESARSQSCPWSSSSRRRRSRRSPARRLLLA
jgi:hypothetical protein